MVPRTWGQMSHAGYLVLDNGVQMAEAGIQEIVRTGMVNYKERGTHSSLFEVQNMEETKEEA